MCKKIYKGNFFLPAVASFSFISVLLSLQTTKSFYLHYLYGLNYWDTNAIFICILTLVLFNRPTKLLFTLLLNFFLKFKFFNLWFLKKQLPDALLIGTIAIHPLMFYFFMLIFLVKSLKLNAKYLHNCLSINKSRLSLYLLVTLLLGGFWGLQSTIWGYFWVNDSVEWLLLLAILGVLYSLHTFDVKILRFNTFILVFFLFNMVLMVRLNIFQTRHSFIEQRNLSSFLLCGYILFCEFIFRKPFLNKKPTKYLTSWAIAFILAGLLVTLTLVTLLFSKICFIFLSVFFFRYLHPKAMPRKTILHILIFTFFFIWGVYFTFFYLTYKKITQNLLEFPYVFVDNFNFMKNFCVKKLELKVLESVYFLVSLETVRGFALVFGTTAFILMNNWLLLYFIYALLIFFL